MTLTPRDAAALAPTAWLPNDRGGHARGGVRLPWSLGRIWAVAFSLAGVASLYFGLQSWLLDMQENGRAVVPSRVTFAGTITWFVWALLSPVMVFVFRAYPVDRRWNFRIVGAYAGAALGAGFVHGLIENPLWFWAVDAPPVVHYGVVLRVIWWTLLKLPTAAMQFLAFAAAYHALALARSARERELSASRAKAALAEAELRALKMRLEPHFLFNTLNAILSYVRHDPPVAEEMIGRLSRLLRSVLQSSGEADVPLTQELALVREYLELHRMRFGDRLTIDITVDEEVAGALIPAMLLQPIVENAVQHGVARRPGAGRISVAASRKDSTAIIEVTDASLSEPGATTLATHVESTSEGSGLGLAVTRARLTQRYGVASRLTLLGRPTGTTVRIELPHSAPNDAAIPA